MNRSEKNKQLHYDLKRESEQIGYILDDLINENLRKDYGKIFDDQMENPMKQLEDMLPRVYRMGEEK